MSARAFVDTNVLLYAHDASTGARHEIARALVEGLWRERTGALSTQVLQELAVNLRRKAARPLSTEATAEVVSDYLSWHVFENDGESILEALRIEKRHGISFWDALIVHAAEAVGATILYSEDLPHGHRYGPVEVVNPFADA